MKTIIAVLGILGCVFGLMGSVLAFAFSSFGGDLTANGLMAVIASIAGLIASISAGKKPFLMGWVLIGSAVIGFVWSFLAFLIPAVLFLIAGVLSLTSKNELPKRDKQPLHTSGEGQ